MNGVSEKEVIAARKARMVDEAKKRIDARVYKIKHEREATAESLKEDLRIAAKSSIQKRNRSPDDGFQLVGDRRKNVNKVAVEEDSESTEGEDRSVTNLLSEAKRNAAALYEEAQEQKE